MTTRRDFLKINLGAASAAVFYPISVQSSISAAETSKPLFAFLYDTQFSNARILANNLADRSHRSLNLVDVNLERIWMNELWSQLSNDQTYIAGVTSGHQAFAIQEASRDLGHAIIHSENCGSKQIGLSDTGLLSCDATLNCIDVLSLNKPEPVFWLLGPSGINFHG